MFLVAVLWLHLEYGAQREILSRCAKKSLCVAVRGQGRGVHARDLWGKQADGADGAPLGRRMARFFTETMHLTVSWSSCALRWNKVHKRGGNTCQAISMYPTCSAHGLNACFFRSACAGSNLLAFPGLLSGLGQTLHVRFPHSPPSFWRMLFIPL